MYGEHNTLDKYLRETQYFGDNAQTHSANLFGINQTNVKQIIATSKNLVGYTFFVRPQLNLSTDNLVADRRYSDYLTTLETSVNRHVRTLLDPRLSFANIACPLTDPLNAFIPVFTNQVETVSGWPDMVLPTYTSPKGLMQNEYSNPDGVINNYSSYDLDVTFSNTGDQAIIKIIHLWLMYMGDLYRGIVNSYVDYLLENERDFDTRIYRLIMSQDNQKVAMIIATGISFPINLGIGKFADFTRATPYGEQIKDLNIRFRSLGVSYLDPINIKEFNDTSSIFNPTMALINKGEQQDTYGLIPYNQMSRLRNLAYPRINPHNSRLEWWTEKSLIL